MRGGRGAGKPRIGQLPAQLLGGGIEIDVRGALAGGGDGGYFGGAAKWRFALFGGSRARVGAGFSLRKPLKHGLGFRHGSLPVRVNKDASFKTMRITFFFRNLP